MSTFSTFPRRQQKKMSTAQTYLVAHTARSKLTREAAKSDHNLRLLVGHANLLDNLMLQLAEQEREQETWFNSTVPSHAAPEQHIRWVDSISEDEDEEALDSDSEDEVEEVPAIPVRARSAPISHIRVYEDDSSDSEDDSEDELDEDEDLESLALVRTHSNVMNSPPALVHDSDSDSEDEGPASPPTQVFEEFTSKSQKKVSQASNDDLYQPQESLFFSPAPVAAY